MAELFTALTGDYADFENNGDGFGWISDCFKSVFFKDDADCTSLAKKVLFLTGDCFREKEQQTPNCCESLARLFCYDEADDIITEKYLSFCLSSEKADTEKADHNRMIKAWENFEHALIENVQHSYQATGNSEELSEFPLQWQMWIWWAILLQEKRRIIGAML